MPSSTARHVPGAQSFLIVFDFDHTLVDCNTDEVIPEYLGRGEVQKALRQQGMQWTTLMDTLVAPFTAAELREAANKSVVADPEMPKLFEFFKGLKAGGNADTLFEINIASDSNLLFIDASLEGALPGVREIISQIHSNPYEAVEEGASVDVTDPVQQSEEERDHTYNKGMTARRSRLHWYERHNCVCCKEGKKPNMCKSRIIQRLLQTTTLVDPTVIFIGDGRNDYCTAQHFLRPRDYIFARRDFPLHDTLASNHWGCCHVKLWKNAGELLSHFRQVMTLAARLPSIVRFNDVGPKEFRSLTLSQRVPSIVNRILEMNRADMSSEGIALMEKLAVDIGKNAEVPPLPGQKEVPGWLKQYATLPEFHHAGVTRRSTKEKLDTAPRWGQLPWVHGEIYLYHLIWQFVMLRSHRPEKRLRSEDGGAVSVNQVTPYAIDNPIYSLDCGGLTTNLAAKPRAPEETFDTKFLVSERLTTGIEFGGNKAGVWPPPASNGRITQLLAPEGDGVLPIPSDVFFPYRDIYAKEKEEVTTCFMDKRVVPMISCEPWRVLASEGGASGALSFLPTLLRWMLWGNAVDLSMFTMEQLKAGGSKAPSGSPTSGGVEKVLAQRRKAEEEMMFGMEARLVGNDTAALQAYITALVQHTPSNEEQRKAMQTNHIDIVMDNVGVEFISDLLFGLWFISHSKRENRAPATVTYHVKPMPYYVSDVTPLDFARQLAMVEEVLAPGGGRYGKETFSDAEKESVRDFLKRVKEALRSGQFAVTSESVNTQPSEYRDLPPGVVNRYFFFQHVCEPKQPGDTSSPTTPNPNLSLIYRENKMAVDPRTALVVFKGDLNYRRLIGDRHWCRTDFFTSIAKNPSDLAHAESSYSPTEKAIAARLLVDTPSEAVMEGASVSDVVGAYWPTHTIPVVSIRTIKSECCLGVPGALKSKLDKEEGLQWRISGKYGLILFAS